MIYQNIMYILPPDQYNKPNMTTWRVLYMHMAYGNRWNNFTAHLTSLKGTRSRLYNKHPGGTHIKLCGRISCWFHTAGRFNIGQDQ